MFWQADGLNFIWNQLGIVQICPILKFCGSWSWHSIISCWNFWRFLEGFLNDPLHASPCSDMLAHVVYEDASLCSWIPPDSYMTFNREEAKATFVSKCDVSPLSQSPLKPQHGWPFSHWNMSRCLQHRRTLSFRRFRTVCGLRILPHLLHSFYISHKETKGVVVNVKLALHNFTILQ